MPSITPNLNKIVLKASFSAGGTEHDEGLATATTTPGMNVVMTTAADVQKRRSYAPGATPVGGTSAGAATPHITIVKEDMLQGKTINDNYASGDNLQLHRCKPGDVIQVLVASGQTITKGNLGAAIASGKWNVATVNGVVEFLEASGGALGADTHMRALVL
jgi:hypothetical protein